MQRGQSDRVPLVFQLKDCKSTTAFNVKVTLMGTEDTDLRDFCRLIRHLLQRVLGLALKLPEGGCTY